MMLEVLHVAQGVHADGAAHEANDEDHDDGELVKIDRRGEHVLGTVRQGEVGEVDDADRLHKADDERELVLVADREPEDHRAEHDVDRGHHDSDDEARLLRELIDGVAAEQVLEREQHRRDARDARCRDGDDRPLALAPKEHERDGGHQRSGDEKCDETHSFPLLT